MRTRTLFIVAFAVIVIAALSLVHLRTQRVLRGYRLSELREELAEQKETLRKQKLQKTTYISAESLRIRRDQTPIDLVEPSQVTPYTPPQVPVDPAREENSTPAPPGATYEQGD